MTQAESAQDWAHGPQADSAETAVPLSGDAREGDEPTPDAAQERLAEFMHGALVQNIVLADRKAGILFTLVSAALLFLFTRVPPALTTWRGGLWLVVVLSLVLAAVCAFIVIFPRTRRRTDDVMFWGAVAGHASHDAYLRAVCSRDRVTLARGKLAYCYDLACICAAKFRLLRAAMIAAALGLVLFLVVLALGLAPSVFAPPPLP